MTVENRNPTSTDENNLTVSASVQAPAPITGFAWIERLTDFVGRSVAVCMVLMVLLTVLVVVLRYATTTNTVLLQEGVMYLHAFAFMLAIPYGLRHQAHVRVDVLYGRLTPRTRAMIDLTGHLLLLVPVACCIAFYSQTYVSNSWRIMETSNDVGGIPAVFILKTLIPVMAVLLLLQGVAEMARCIHTIRQAGEASTR